MEKLLTILIICFSAQVYGKPPGEGIGNPRQHSCLENPMDGGA